MKKKNTRKRKRNSNKLKGLPAKRGKAETEGDATKEFLRLYPERYEKFITEMLNNPENFLEPNPQRETKILALLKHLFDFAQTNSPQGADKCILEELFIKDFDIDQIWEEIQLYNEPMLNFFDTYIASTDPEDESDIEENDGEDRLQEFLKEDEADEDSSLSSSSSDEDDSNEENSGDENDEEHKEVAVEELLAMDHRFFNMDDMYAFMDQGEAVNRKIQRGETLEDSDEEEIDLFAEIPEDDQDGFAEFPSNQKKPKKQSKKLGGGIMYDDFFDPPDNENGENSDSDDDDQTLTRFQKRNAMLRDEIKKLEDFNVQIKPWQLQGEVAAKDRPENSLLENWVDFEVASKPNVVPTEASTMALEEIIINRIKEESWDDVERKTDLMEYNRDKIDRLKREKISAEEAMDYEKNEKGLGDIYAQKFVEAMLEHEKARASEGTGDLEAKLQELQDKRKKKRTPKQREVERDIKKLFFKLDSLSGFQFLPVPPEVEVTITPNVPGIEMEEIIPIGLNQESLLAPEEIYEKPKGEVKADSEISKAQKKARRQAKKRRRKKKDHKTAAEIAALKRADPNAKPESLDQVMKELKNNTRVTVDSTARLDKKGFASSEGSKSIWKQLTAETKQLVANASQKKEHKS